MKKFAELTGRQYELYSYYGDRDAERIVVIMGSGTGAIHEIVDYLNKQGEKVGCLNVHLFPSI
jgi:pyruvate-ferredoxin/flavodoxin oxidoreductase